MRISIYTDGSCSENPGPGGWCVVLNTEDECKTFSGGESNTTNNRMELTAVIEAVKWAMSLNVLTNEFVIYSDSAYVINSINKGWLDRWKTNGWKTKQGHDIKNRDLWEELDDKMKKAQRVGYDIRFDKVKGHNGNAFNELADKIARVESAKHTS